jgi:hypothetical protein
MTQLTAVVFSMVVWFSGRWLLGRGDIQLRPFRYLQDGFAIGDVVLIAIAAHCLATRTGTPALWMAQAALAGGGAGGARGAPGPGARGPLTCFTSRA